MSLLARRRPAPTPPLRRLLVGVAALALAIAIVIGAGRVGVLPGARFGPNATGAPRAADERTLAERQIESALARLTTVPNDRVALTRLGQLYLQRARESGDPAFYPRAEAAFQRALAADDRDVAALTGLGALALARHQFREALVLGERALALAPHTAAVYGLVGDAQIELGRYPEAVATFQRMVDLRPDLDSYARVSYARELHGHVPGAIDAMRRAAEAGATGQEGTSWARVQLGHLHLNSGASGALDAAEAEYRRAETETPGYLHALAGLGRVAAARGDWARAIEHYERATATVPLPEYVGALGDVYAAAGQPDAAADAYALVRVQARLQAASGINTDLELALFAADHPEPGGDPWQVVAQARAALAERPNIYAHDALAWTLFRAGDYDAAWEESRAALRLGTRDPLLHFHAGAIAKARGDREGARRHFGEALAINPHFSLLHAPAARAALAELQ